MAENDVRDWFAEYLCAFAALGRGESRPADVVPYFGVPLLLTTDTGIIWLGTTDEVAAWLQSQADALSAAGYHHTETLTSDVATINGNTAIHRAGFSRQRPDGTEINQLTVTYIITRESEGFRICALLLH